MSVYIQEDNSSEKGTIKCFNYILNQNRTCAKLLGRVNSFQYHCSYLFFYYGKQSLEKLTCGIFGDSKNGDKVGNRFEPTRLCHRLFFYVWCQLFKYEHGQQYINIIKKL